MLREKEWGAELETATFENQPLITNTNFTIMSRKKLNNILFTSGLVALIAFSSCGGLGRQDSSEMRTDTLNNWATVDITFQPTTTARARQDYVDYCKGFFMDYVRASSDSARGRTFNATIQETTKDSLRYIINVRVGRTYFLKDSVSDPRPPCPPRPGPRSLEEALLNIDCALSDG